MTLLYVILWLETENMHIIWQGDKMKVMWYPCPECGNRHMIKVREDTELKNFPAFCKRCRTESLISYPRSQSREPEPINTV